MATHRIQSAIVMNGNPQSYPLQYVQLLMGTVLRFYIHTPIKSWNNPGDISLPWNCASALKSNTHHPAFASTHNRTKTNHHWLNHLQTLHTLNCATSLVVGLRGRSKTLGATKGNIELTSLPHSTCLTPETEIASSFLSGTPGTQRRTRLIGR